MNVQYILNTLKKIICAGQKMPEVKQITFFLHSFQ